MDGIVILKDDEGISVFNESYSQLIIMDNAGGSTGICVTNTHIITNENIDDNRTIKMIASIAFS